MTQSGHFEPAIAAVFGLAQTHQFLAANDKTNLTPDALSKRKTFFGLVVRFDDIILRILEIV